MHGSCVVPTDDSLTTEQQNKKQFGAIQLENSMTGQSGDIQQGNCVSSFQHETFLHLSSGDISRRLGFDVSTFTSGSLLGRGSTKSSDMCTSPAVATYKRRQLETHFEMKISC